MNVDGETKQIANAFPGPVDRRRRPEGRSWCRYCEREVEFVPLDEVNRLLDRAGRVDRHGIPILGQSVHFAKRSDTVFLICVRSLLAEA